MTELNKGGNVNALKLVGTIIERGGVEPLQVSWKGNYNPQELMIGGELKKVQYMRDGIITFDDNTVGQYERLGQKDGEFSAMLVLKVS